MNKRLTAFFLAFCMTAVFLPGWAAGQSAENIAHGVLSDVEYYDADGKLLVADTSAVANMTDDNEFSLYKTPVGVARGSITLDFYQPRQISRVYIKEMNETVQEFAVYTSNNRKDWSRCYSGNTIGAYGLTFHFKPVNTRFLKIELTRTANEYRDASITISEIKVYQSSGIAKEDLDTAIYMGETKLDFINGESVRAHFTDEERGALASYLTIAEGLREADNAMQTAVDAARDDIRKYIAYLDAKPEAGQADFKVIQERYFNQFTKNDQEMTEARKKAVDSQEQTARKNWETMLKRPNATELWSEYIPPMANSSQEPGKIANTCGKLKQMAIAYKQNGNGLRDNPELFQDILYGLDFVLEKKYSPSIAMYGNWYYWQVSTPATLTDIMAILVNDLPREMKGRIESAINYWVGEDFHYTWSGANRMYLAAMELKLGAVMENEEYIHRTVYALAEENTCLDRQQPGVSGVNNGFFWDGSYIFHEGYLYNATYGRDQMTNTLSIISYLYGTLWQVDQAMLDELAGRIEDGYEGVIYNGYSSDVASGRGLGAQQEYGLTMTQGIEKLAGYLRDPYRTQFLSVAKQFKLEQGIKDALTENPDIIPRGRITRLNRYPIGDKLILHTPDYGFGLSMFSNRTKTFEAPNGDAMKAWYVSSGMTQLYSDDRAQYNRDYWIAVDHYRLAGTTVDRIPRSLTRYDGEMFNSNSWCGIIDCGETYAAAGMMENNWNSSLEGKKSYFVFDNEIVCLGSGISKGTERIETTVENRMLKQDNTNQFLINNQPFDAAGEKQAQGVKSAYLEGNTDGVSYGYYFPGGAELHVLRETRTGAEADMWLSDTDNKVTASFLTMWYDHGKQPLNAEYAYVLLPQFSAEETEQYAQNPEIEILSQTNEVHAVRDNRIGVTGYNFWNARGGSGGGVSADRPLTMISQEDETQLALNLTDPTFAANKPVTLTFDQPVSAVLEADERVTVKSLNPLKLEVNLKDVNGKKVMVKAAKKPVSYQPQLLRSGVAVLENGSAAVADNLVSVPPAEPLERDGNLYLPLEWLAGELGSRYAVSEETGAAEVIGDSVLRAEADGSVWIGGKARESDIPLSLRQDGVLYLELETAADFYQKYAVRQDGVAMLTETRLGEVEQTELAAGVKTYLGER